MERADEGRAKSIPRNVATVRAVEGRGRSQSHGGLVSRRRVELAVEPYPPTAACVACCCGLHAGKGTTIRRALGIARHLPGSPPLLGGGMDRSKGRRWREGNRGLVTVVMAGELHGGETALSVARGSGVGVYEYNKCVCACVYARSEAGPVAMGHSLPSQDAGGLVRRAGEGEARRTGFGTESQERRKRGRIGDGLWAQPQLRVGLGRLGGQCDWQPWQRRPGPSHGSGDV